MNVTRWTAITLSTLTFTVSACAGNAASHGKDMDAELTPTPSTVAVAVKNANYWDMKIYALVNGSVPMRLGTVVGMSSGTFTVSRSMFPTGTLRLVGSQIGGRSVADSGELQVSGGQSVTFTIQPNTATSFAFVR